MDRSQDWVKQFTEFKQDKEYLKKITELEDCFRELVATIKIVKGELEAQIEETYGVKLGEKERLQ